MLLKPITLVVYESAGLDDAYAFVRKNIFPYAPAMMILPMVANVAVDGKDYEVSVTVSQPNGETPCDMCICVETRRKSKWSFVQTGMWSESKRRRVRLLVGGEFEEIPESLANTRWVTEVGPGWLGKMVKTYIKGQPTYP